MLTSALAAGNRALDISGSYGVNVHGYNFYKVR